MIFKKLELPKLEKLYLFNNKISSPEIFSVLKKFKNLKLIFLGHNLFNKNEIDKIKEIIELPLNLIELGIGKCFTSETNNFITNNLNMKNIKLLYVSGNGFINFEGFKKVKFLQLKEFWSTGGEKEGYLTDIKEIFNLNNKETIRKIVLKQNRINNIEELIDIIKYFPGLTVLNVKNNNIREDRIKNVLNNIKQIEGFKKFKIEYN